MATARKGKSKRRTRAEVQRERSEYVERERKLWYERGLKEGKQQAEQDESARLERESLKVRLELGRAFAVVFEGITRSAAMFFDGGFNAFRGTEPPRR